MWNANPHIHMNMRNTNPYIYMNMRNRANHSLGIISLLLLHGSKSFKPRTLKGMVKKK